MKQQVAILGAGGMGSALARAFLRNGYPLAVWNRTLAKAEALAAEGARVSKTVEDAVAGADVVIGNVHDYEVSKQLLQPPRVAASLRGKMLVQLASGSPREARELSAWAEQHGIEYLDGAIMATPNLIGQPATTILYSGPLALFEKYRPLLLVLAGNTVHVGSDVGHASVLDSGLLAYLWGAMFGALQGVVVAEAEGISADKYREYLTATAPMVNGAVVDLVTRIEQRRYAHDATTLASIDAHYGALRHLLEVSRAWGIHARLPEAFAELLQKAIQAGHAQADFAVLHQFMSNR